MTALGGRDANDVPIWLSPSEAEEEVLFSMLCRKECVTAGTRMSAKFENPYNFSLNFYGFQKHAPGENAAEWMHLDADVIEWKGEQRLGSDRGRGEFAALKRNSKTRIRKFAGVARRAFA